MRFVFLVALLVLAFALGLPNETAAAGFAVVTFKNENALVRVNAEVAETPSETQRGLMFRTSLPEDSGMLFVFDRDQPLTFWMMNTSIPLDGIFISSLLRVVSITENLKSCPPSDCRNPQYFTSATLAMYVLEVNAGFSRKNGITSGTQVSIQRHSESVSIERHSENESGYLVPGAITVLIVLTVGITFFYRRRRMITQRRSLPPGLLIETL